MKPHIVTVNDDEVVLGGEAADNRVESLHLAKEAGDIGARMSSDEPLVLPWHAIVGVREVGD
jgi:hypothetical protein